MKDKKASSVEHHFLINPLHSQYEEELDRIRTEGDLTLIKAQTERKKLVELEAKLAQAHKQPESGRRPPTREKRDRGPQILRRPRGSSLPWRCRAAKRLPSSSCRRFRRWRRSRRPAPKTVHCYYCGYYSS